MSITEKLFQPLMSTPSRPLITYYDGDGTRIELSRATMANWVAKTANWLRDECDVEPEDPVAVCLPAHWQTIGVLFGAWSCGAQVTDDLAKARVAFVSPGHSVAGVETLAVVALDPLGRGLDHEPIGAVDYVNEIRSYGDEFIPFTTISGSSLALKQYTVDELVGQVRQKSAELAITSNDRVLSTMEWKLPEGVTNGLLAVLAGQAPLVQSAHADAATLAARGVAERVTITLSD